MGNGGIHTIGGQQPIYPSVDFEAKRNVLKNLPMKTPVSVQASMDKAAKVKSQVDAQPTGEVPKDVSPQNVTGKLESGDLKKLGHQPEAVQVKQQIEKTNQFLSKVLSFFKKILSSLNPMAYFNKGKDQAQATKKMPSTEQTPSYVKGLTPDQSKAVGTMRNAYVTGTFVKGTPEELSAASTKLHEFLMANAGELFKEEGIFRLSGSQSGKIELFNKLMADPKSVNLNDVSDPILLAAVFKQIYRDMNLFGSDKDSAKFEEIGNKLLAEKDPQKVIALLKELKGSLEPDRQADLKKFIQVLAKVQEQSNVNKMATSNLAIVAGPNLCDIDVDPLALVSFTGQRQAIASLFITHYKEVFEG